MPALKLLALIVVMASVSGCKKKVSPAQCEAIVDRYAELVVVESMPDASATDIAKERAREKTEAHGADVFKNCSSEIQLDDYDCAMRAQSPHALEVCLE